LVPSDDSPDGVIDIANFHDTMPAKPCRRCRVRLFGPKNGWQFAAPRRGAGTCRDHNLLIFS
jgi:hypothetical protein